jgi:hypothetical protein
MTTLSQKTIGQTIENFAFALALLAVSTSAVLAQSATKSDMSANSYGDARQSRAWCKANTTGAARADCLEYSYSNPGERSKSDVEANNADFAGNALSRCNVFKGAEDRMACDARVKGQGSNSGSVQGGGILKEVTTVTRPDVPGVVTIEPKKP